MSFTRQSHRGWRETRHGDSVRTSSTNIMHTPIRAQALAWTRSLHVSSSLRHLVGPNDPVSNLRPIIYTDTPTPPASQSQTQHVNHPYSLHEFTDLDVPHNHTLELRYKLAREQLDAFNHNYWTDVRRDNVPFDSGCSR